VVLGYLLYVGLVVGSLGGFVLGLRYVSEGFDEYAVRNAIRGTPVSSFNSLALGPVAIRGIVGTDRPHLSAPIGAGDCVAYSLFVRDWSRRTDDTLVDERRSVPFYVETEDGRVLIDSDGFEFDVSDDRRYERKVESHQSVPEELRTFEDAWSLHRRQLNHDRRYEQRFLREGDEVYAYGTAVAVEDRDSGAGGVANGDSDDSAKRVRLTNGRGPFFVSDLPPERLLRDRRLGLAKSVAKGTILSTVSLGAFLGLTGLATLLFG
jgi:hypothetical protein